MKTGRLSVNAEHCETVIAENWDFVITENCRIARMLILKIVHAGKYGT